MDPTVTPIAVAADVPQEAPSTAELEHPFTIHNRLVVKKLLAAGVSVVGASVVVGGWVRTGRTAEAGALAFLEISDGSCIDTLQCVVRKEVHDLKELTATGTSVLLRGVIKQHPEKTDVIEVHATEVLTVGACPSDYPMAKGKTAMTLEYLRSQIHLRVRTNTIAAITRVRNALAAATHRFFQEQGFLYVHTPVVTASDCEGAGEMFQLTTLLSKAEKEGKVPGPTAEELTAAVAAVDAIKAEVVLWREKKEKKKHKQSESNLAEAEAKLKLLKNKAASLGGLARSAETGEIDYKEDFFGRPAHLTVSGQLEAEAFACALTSVYTFGPTFRAEYSFTSRHLAEFWMIEPEIAFCDLAGNMACAEAYVQFCLRAALTECHGDLLFLQDRFDKTLIERLSAVANTPFKRLPYTEGIELLKAAVADGVVFENPIIEWGMDLGSEHERHLAEKIFKGPVILFNYPKEIKSFYMRLNDDHKTVAAMDVLVPGIGELVGGSQREERVDVLVERIKEVGLDVDTYAWYLELRRYGTVPHSGFGLGFECLVLFATAVENIRDVIAFPRWANHIL